jgi:hypothetical protein
MLNLRDSTEKEVLSLMILKNIMILDLISQQPVEVVEQLKRLPFFRLLNLLQLKDRDQQAPILQLIS